MLMNFEEVCKNIISIDIESHNNDDDNEFFFSMNDIEVSSSSISKFARKIKTESGDLLLLAIAGSIKRYIELSGIAEFHDNGYKIKTVKIVEVFERIALGKNMKK